MKDTLYVSLKTDFDERGGVFLSRYSNIDFHYNEDTKEYEAIDIYYQNRLGKLHLTPDCRWAWYSCYGEGFYLRVKEISSKKPRLRSKYNALVCARKAYLNDIISCKAKYEITKELIERLGD